MKKAFLVKCIIISLPVLIMLAMFCVYDPFRIVKHYDDFYIGDVESQPPFVTPNRDYVSSELYINNNEKYGYDAFIFGSSRTLAYNTKDWKKYIDSSAKPFLFDAMSENLFGIYKKIKYIDKNGGIIKYAIILIDGDVTFKPKDENAGHLYAKHPVVSGDSWFPGADWLAFYGEFIKSYFDPEFFWNYYKFVYTGKRADEFADKWIVWNEFRFDNITNDMMLNRLDTMINIDANKYYSERAPIFYTRDSIKLEPAVINEEQIEMLKEIREIFNRQGTNFRIVISPLYTQQKFNSEDLIKLNGIFGVDKVFDFSGKNSITENIQNYYENSHYRTKVGDTIMSTIYRKPQ